MANRSARTNSNVVEIEHPLAMQVMLPLNNLASSNSSGNFANESTSYIWVLISFVLIVFGLPMAVFALGAKLPPPLDLLPYLFMVVVGVVGFGITCFTLLWLYHWHLDRQVRRMQVVGPGESRQVKEQPNTATNENEVDQSISRSGEVLIKSERPNEAARTDFYLIDGQVDEVDFWQVVRHPYLHGQSSGDVETINARKLAPGEMEKTVNYYGNNSDE